MKIQASTSRTTSRHTSAGSAAVRVLSSDLQELAAPGRTLPDGRRRHHATSHASVVRVQPGLVRRRPDRWEVGRAAHRTERRDHLRREDREVSRSRRLLLDDQRSTRKAGVGPDRVLGREHGPAEELVPDREREAEVDVLRSVDLVVDAVVVRADEDPFEGSEAQPGVRVRERDDRAVDDEHRDRHHAVGEQHDAGEQRHEIRHVDERMGAEDGEHAHVLLRVVQLVEPPEHAGPVVREVHRPVAAVHGHDDQRDRRPTRHDGRSGAGRSTAATCGRRARSRG